ncbi:MAG TPA: DinB family protein [Saprospiraceae bacterium]|nr:DinB family protein [Saprospiraceae bacterium]
MPVRIYHHPSDTVESSLTELQHILETVPLQLKAFSDQEFSTPPAPGKWSKKQIIGHLIDSAANNHQRFVRAQFEDHPAISYDQERWNVAGHYEEMNGYAVIDFWAAYNHFILQLISKIPPTLMERTCRMSDGSLWTISTLFVDYVAHLKHHLLQIEELRIK